MEMKYALRNISKSYGDLEVFRDLSLEFIRGKINCILGPSGCGKTTLLNIISGSVKPDSGDRNDFVHARISYVFQDPRLLPWKTVWGNIAFVLKDRLKKDALHKRVEEHVKKVELLPFADYYPSRLSGGMRQRVSLARAFSYDSGLILMDEPFQALDIRLRNNLTRYFMDLWNNDNRTVIFVTHDVGEAVKMGERIFILGQPPAGLIHIFNSQENPDAHTLKKEINRIMSA